MDTCSQYEGWKKAECQETLASTWVTRMAWISLFPLDSLISQALCSRKWLSRTVACQMGLLSSAPSAVGPGAGCRAGGAVKVGRKWAWVSLPKPKSSTRWPLHGFCFSHSPLQRSLFLPNLSELLKTVLFYETFFTFSSVPLHCWDPDAVPVNQGGIETLQDQVESSDTAALKTSSVWTGPDCKTKLYMGTGSNQKQWEGISSLEKT